MKIAYLGAGAWGFTLATLLAENGHDILVWEVKADLVELLRSGEGHPNLDGKRAPENMSFTTELADVLKDVDLLVEGVTSAGLRPVFTEIKKLGVPSCPIVLTSKGIEQNTGLLLTDVAVEVLGEEHRHQIGCISGPTIAREVAKGLPASAVCSAYAPEVMEVIAKAFGNQRFRVYPNADINGVEAGGALKNIVAIACGLSDGLGYGDNAKAALMTRGLHEIRKIATTMGCQPETMNGLAGMGDLCVTCLSTHSRNYRFGHLIAEGLTAEEAKKSIGMVVEGTYSVVSAHQLSKKSGVDMPITEAVYNIIYEGITPQEAVQRLLQREVKEEHL